MLAKLIAGLFVLSPSLFAAETQPLFNGKNLDGWTFDHDGPDVKPQDVWSVVDGVLVCKGKPPGVMRTKKDYSNYELTVEWRWAPGGEPGNSGILVHASKTREIGIWPKSVEVQLGHPDAGDFWMIGEKVTVKDRTPEGRRIIKKEPSSEKKPGEWNTARVRCQGDKLTVWINGTLMNEGTDLSATKGAICLQSEGSEVHFRKIELTPIE